MRKIKVNRWKKKWIVAVVIAVLAVAGGSAAYLNQGIVVSTDMAKTGVVLKLIKETGTVEARNKILVSAKSSGELKGLVLTEGEVVTAGQVLLESSQSGARFDIKSLQSQLSGLQTQYNQAKTISDKNQALYGEGALSYEEYAASLTTAKQLSSQIAALHYNIQSFQETSGAGEVLSPMAGVVTEVFAENGQIATAGAPLFEIADLSYLYIETKLITEDADRVETGMLVRVKNDQDDIVDEAAVVTKVHPKAVSFTSELGVTQKRVIVEIDMKAQRALRLGSDLTIEITTDKKDSILVVPSQCVFEQDHKNWVYLVENDIAKLQAVEIGLEGEDGTGQELTEITSGLEEGAVIIVAPDDQVKNGVRIKPAK